jgi:hypothetical protein
MKPFPAAQILPAWIFILPLVLLGFGGIDPARATVVVSASVTQTAAGSPNSYGITLNNNSTNSEAVSTFWFAWVPGKDFLATSPTNVVAPAGWTYTITHSGVNDGYAIEFNTTTAAVAANNLLSGFSFQSTSSIAQLQGNSTFYSTTPVMTSVAFTGGGGVETTFVATFQTQLVIFGNSMCDEGNTYNTGGTFSGHPLTPPNYTVGKYTDGPDTTPSTSKIGIWADQLAVLLGLPSPTPSTSGGCDYSYGGSVTGMGGNGTPPGMGLQVNQFLADFPSPSPTATYALWGPASDFYAVTQASALPATEAAAIANLKTEIGQLATAGAKNFIWFNDASLGNSPAGIAQGFPSALSAADAQFNNDWAAAISQLEATYPSIKITAVDLYSLGAQITANPSAYGFTNITTPAQGNAAVNPDTYGYWDIEHQTTAGHGLIANLAFSDLNGPGTTSQTITFSPIATQIVGTSLPVSATASSGLQVTYSIVSGSATLYGNVVNLTGSGTVVLQANQIGNGTYAAAAAAQQSFTVNAAPQTINFPAIGNQAYPGSNYVLSATASSGLTVGFNLVSGPATQNGNTLTFNGTGQVMVTANQSGNGNYAAAPSVTQTFNVVAQATDVGNYGIEKNMIYDQTSTATPTLDPKQPFQFFINVNPGSSGTLLTSSAVTPPPGTSGTVAFQSGPNGLQFNEAFTSSAALDAAYPNGSYDLTVRTSTPNTYDTQFNLGPTAYPAIPQITVTGGNGTWTGNMLVIDPTKPVTFNWPVFAGGANGGGINFSINNSSQFFPADGTHNSYVLPMNSLSANGTYQCFISFYAASANSNPNPIPGSTNGGAAGFQTQVNFIINTGAASSSGKSTYIVEKSNILTQTSTSAPANVAGDVYDAAPYNLTIEGPTGGTATGPGAGSPYTLAFDTFSDNNPYKYSSGSITSLSALNSAYPDGNYTLADGNTVSLTGDTYPSVPQVTAVNGNTPVWNPLGQLMLDPTISNTLTWTAFSGGNFSTSGHESAEVSSYTGDSLDVSMSSGLINGGPAFNTLTIQAGTMTAGHTYIGDISYLLASAFTNPTTNVFDVAGYNTETYFTIVATTPLSGSTNAQTIDFVPVGAATYSSNATVPLVTSTSSGLPVTFSVVSGPATVSGNTLTLTGAGAVTVKASAAGNANYVAASDVQQVINVGTDSQTINFSSLSNATFGASPFALSATASSGSTVTFTVASGPATITNGTLTITGAGTVVVQANQTGGANYNAATSVQQSFTVSPATQSINFPTIASPTYGVTPFALNATATSTLPVSFTVVSGPGTLSGNMLTVTGAGTIQVQATQGGNGNYATAAGVTQNITVNKASQSITFPTIATQSFPSGPVTVNATATSGQTVSFAILNGPATVTGNTVTLTGTGSVMIQASQAGNTNYLAATSVTQTFAVNATTNKTYTLWIAQFPTTTNTSPTATPENDGVTNLLKYLANINPSRPMTEADRAALSVFGTANSGATLTLTYRQYQFETGILINVQTSPDLKIWTTLAPPQYTVRQMGTDPNTSDPIMEITTPANGTSKNFIRLNVTMP